MSKRKPKPITPDQKLRWWYTHMNDIDWFGKGFYSGGMTNDEAINQYTDDDLANFALIGIDVDEILKTQIHDREEIWRIYLNYMQSTDTEIPYDPIPFSDMANTLFENGAIEAGSKLASVGVSEISIGFGLMAGFINGPEDNSDVYERYYTTSDVMLSYIGEENYKKYITQDTNTSKEIWAEINNQFIESVMLAEKSNIMEYTVTVLTGKATELKKLTPEQIKEATEFYNNLPKEFQVALLSLIDTNTPVINLNANIDSIQDDDDGEDHWPEVIEDEKSKYQQAWGEAYKNGLASDHYSGYYMGDKVKKMLGWQEERSNFHQSIPTEFFIDADKASEIAEAVEKVTNFAAAGAVSQDMLDYLNVMHGTGDYSTEDVERLTKSYDSFFSNEEEEIYKAIMNKNGGIANSNFFNTLNDIQESLDDEAMKGGVMVTKGISEGLDALIDSGYYLNMVVKDTKKGNSSTGSTSLPVPPDVQAILDDRAAKEKAKRTLNRMEARLAELDRRNSSVSSSAGVDELAQVIDVRIARTM